MKKKTRLLLIFMLFIQLIFISGANSKAFAENYVKITGGTPSASSQSSSDYDASKAFDSNTSTYWVSEPVTYGGMGTSPPATPSQQEWLRYQLSSSRVVTKYSVTSVAITSWALQGSNDGSSWTTLHNGTQSQLGQEITFSNTTSYIYYQILAYGVGSCQAIPYASGYYVFQCNYIVSTTELELYFDACNPTGTLEGLYECPGAIVTDGIVESGTSATLSSSQSITLSPGFWAKSGSTFSANLDLDTDSDGIPDIWEYQYGSDLSLFSATGDSDGDGLTDLQEYQLGTSPTNTDTDGDGMPDGWEYQYGLNPLVDDAYLDLDGDGIPNITEYTAGSDPSDPDSRPKGNYYEYDELGRIKSIIRSK